MNRPTSIIIFSLPTVAANRQTPENYAILGYCAASSGSDLSTFRNNLSVPSQGSRWRKARDIHWFGGWVGPTACLDTSLMRLIYAHIFVPFPTLNQAPWTRAITNSRCRALRRHDPCDFFPLFFTNCLRSRSPWRFIFFSTQQSLPLLDNSPHYLIMKFKVRTLRKTVWMRSIFLACTQQRKGNIDRRYHMADLAVYGRLLLKWIVNIVRRRGMDCIVWGLSLGTGPLKRWEWNIRFHKSH